MDKVEATIHVDYVAVCDVGAGGEGQGGGRQDWGKINSRKRLDT